MKAVLDTNVVVSAALTAQGSCARIVDMLAGRLFDLCADDRILAEYDAVLRRPEFGFAPAGMDALMELVGSIALHIVATPLSAELPDPDDLPFLEVAAAADALLVTGNTRHFPQEACGQVRVVNPREFLEILRRAS